MPKLDNTHLSSRIERELERLKDGEALVIRNVKAVLSAEQWAAVEAAWKEQKQLHRSKRSRDESQRKEWGMKDKRELYIGALENALAEARGNMAGFLRKAQVEATRRQIEIYTDAVKEMRAQGKEIHVTRNYANNELTRAKLNRLDRASISVLDKRDREVNELEEQLRARMRAEMTDEEHEQQDLLEQFLQRKNS